MSVATSSGSWPLLRAAGVGTLLTLLSLLLLLRGLFDLLEPGAAGVTLTASGS